MRKCGFFDCSNQIKWHEVSCNKCFGRKENFMCDACLQDINIYALGSEDYSYIDGLNDTEVFLERIRKMFSKLPPRFHDKLKEIEQSLILTKEEQQAIEKTKLFRINFLQEKAPRRYQRHNIHLFKFCKRCADEIKEKERKFIQENPDVRKISERWEKNQKRHAQILGEIEQNVGKERAKKISEELELEIKEKVPKNFYISPAKSIEQQKNTEKIPIRNEKNSQTIFWIAGGVSFLLGTIIYLTYLNKKKT